MNPRYPTLLAALLPLALATAQEAPRSPGPPVANPVPVAPPPVPTAAPAPTAAAPAPAPASAGPSRVFIPPSPPNPGTYQKLADPSPFTNRPSAPTGPEEPPPSDLSLIGLMTLDGKTNVWVQPKDAEEPIQLVEGETEPNEAGLKLVRVVSPNDMYKAVAEIEAGGHLMQVRFTEANLSLAPGAGASKGGGGRAGGVKPGGGPPVPGQPGQPGNPAQGQASKPNPPPGVTGSTPTLPKPPPTVTPRRRIILPK